MSVVRKSFKPNNNPRIQNGQMPEPNPNTGHVAHNLISDGEHNDRTVLNNHHNQLNENYTHTYQLPSIMINRRLQPAQIMQYSYRTPRFVRNRDRVVVEIISILVRESILDGLSK